MKGWQIILLIVLTVLVITGLGNALMADATEAAAPTTTGLAVAPSPLDVEVAGQWAVSLPSAGTPGAESELSVLILQIEQAWGRSEWDRCIDILTVIVTIDPANALMWERLYQARVNYGWLLVCRQRHEDAYKQFTLALRIRPEGKEALEGLRLLQQLYVPEATVCAPPVVVPTVCAPQVVVPVPTVCAECAVPPAVATTRVYVVQRGDNLFRIALRFNVNVTVLMKVNGLQTTTIKVGQKLVIP